MGLCNGGSDCVRVHFMPESRKGNQHCRDWERPIEHGPAWYSLGILIGLLPWLDDGDANSCNACKMLMRCVDVSVVV